MCNRESEIEHRGVLGRIWHSNGYVSTLLSAGFLLYSTNCHGNKIKRFHCMCLYVCVWGGDYKYAVCLCQCYT